MLSRQLLVLGAGLGAISVVGVLVSKPIVAMIPKKWFNRMQYWLTAYAGAIPCTPLPAADSSDSALRMNSDPRADPVRGVGSVEAARLWARLEHGRDPDGAHPRLPNQQVTPTSPRCPPHCPRLNCFPFLSRPCAELDT